MPCIECYYILPEFQRQDRQEDIDQKEHLNDIYRACKYFFLSVIIISGACEALLCLSNIIILLSVQTSLVTRPALFVTDP